MKKKLVAIMLSVVMIAGNISSISAIAAEGSTEQEMTVFSEEADSTTLDENETAYKEDETEDTVAITEEIGEGSSNEEANEEDNTASNEEVIEEDNTDPNEEIPEENASIIEQQEVSEETPIKEETDVVEDSSHDQIDDTANYDSNDINSDSEEQTQIDEELQVEQTIAVEETSDDTESSKEAVNAEINNTSFTINASFSDRFNNYYGNNNLWFTYSDLQDWCSSGFDDSGFYYQEPYQNLFLQNTILSIATVENGVKKEIDPNQTYRYVDLTKDYYLIVKYPLAEGYSPNNNSVVTVDGKSVVWSYHNNTLEFSFQIIKGQTLSLGFANGTGFTICAGDEQEVDFDYYDTVISSLSSSNSSIVKAEVGYNSIRLMALKPGQATITVKGENGSVGKISVTVTSFLTKSSITINSGKTVTIDKKGDNYDEIIGTSNSNPKVVSVQRDLYSINIKGKYPGTSVVTVKAVGGSTSTIKITVKPALKSTTNTPTVKYGSKTITGKTTPGAKVTAKIGKKSYKAVAAASGKYTIKIPIVKIGTKIYLKYTSAGTSLSKTISVKKCSSKIETTYWTYRDSTRVRGKAKNVHVGDYIKVAVNGRTYKKKITKNASTFSFSIKIKKPGKYGIRLTTSLYNKYNQRLAIEKEYVYKSNVVEVGDTKNTVKWLTGWNDPVRKNYYTYSEQWCYDWSGDGLHDAYLYFEDGRVTSWSIYED